MAMLILNLTYTTLVANENVDKVYPCHQLSDRLISAPISAKGQVDRSGYIRLINVRELSELIKTAYEHDGLIIATGSAYDGRIRTILANHLEVSAEIKAQVKNCPFISVYCPEPWKTGKKIYEIENEHLNHFLLDRPDLKSMRFVSLDDQKTFEGHPRVVHVRSTVYNYGSGFQSYASEDESGSDMKAFYETTKQVLIMQSQLEKQSASSTAIILGSIDSDSRASRSESDDEQNPVSYPSPLASPSSSNDLPQESSAQCNLL